MRDVRQWLMILLFLTMIGFSRAESFYETACHSVVHIRVPKIMCEKVDGKWYEIWLRSTTSGTPVPKMRTNSGTGFLLLHSNAAYVVTAKHVVADDAGRVTDAGEVWLNVKDRPALSLQISFMAKGRHGWFLHPTTDVALLPYSRPVDLHVQAW